MDFKKHNFFKNFAGENSKDDLILFGFLAVAFSVLIVMNSVENKKNEIAVNEVPPVRQIASSNQLSEDFEKLKLKIKIPLERELQLMNQEERMSFLLENAHQTLRFKKFVQDHPWSKEKGFRFFLDCALNPEAVRSYRAQCWSSAQGLYYEVFNKELNPEIAPLKILRTARQ